MLSDVREYYGLVREISQSGYFETAQSQQILKELKLAITDGKLIALAGIVGTGRARQPDSLRSVKYCAALTGRKSAPPKVETGYLVLTPRACPIVADLKPLAGCRLAPQTPKMRHSLVRGSAHITALPAQVQHRRQPHRP